MQMYRQRSGNIQEKSKNIDDQNWGATEGLGLGMEVKGEFHLISKMYSRLDFFFNLLTSPLVLANFDSDEQLKLKSVVTTLPMVVTSRVKRISEWALCLAFAVFSVSEPCGPGCP